jgi:tetratricopeptide (TPR) repeat protein
MALPRFLAAVAVCFTLASAPALANEVQDINQQFRKGDLNGALDRANRYLAKNPKDAQARFLKGLILADQGKTNDAIDVFTALTEDYPELPEPYNNLAVLYASQSKYEAAKNAWKWRSAPIPAMPPHTKIWATSTPRWPRSPTTRRWRSTARMPPRRPSSP